MSTRGRIAVLVVEFLGLLLPLHGSGQAAANGKDGNQGSERGNMELWEGGIIRGPTLARRLAIVFTGHGFAEGGEGILNELGKHEGKGSFFLTGEFLTNGNFKPLIQRIAREGHYRSE